MARQTELTTRRPRGAHPAASGNDAPAVAPLRRHTGETTGQHQIALAYTRMRDRLLRVARSLLGRGSSVEDAEDVLQDAMTKYLMQRSRAGATIGAEEQDARLVLMVGDVARDRLRQRRREAKQRLKVSGASAAARRWSNTRLRADQQEIAAQIEVALGKVPPQYREAWRLVRDEQLSFAEAATIMELPAKTLRSYVCRTNHALRLALAKSGLTPQTLRGRTDA